MNVWISIYSRLCGSYWPVNKVHVVKMALQLLEIMHFPSASSFKLSHPGPDWWDMCLSPHWKGCYWHKCPHTVHESGIPLPSPLKPDSDCDCWPPSSSSTSSQLLPASRCLLWVSDWIDAWQESEGSAHKLSSIDPEWISDTLILSVYETIHPAGLDSPPSSGCLLTFSQILSGIFSGSSRIYYVDMRVWSHRVTVLTLLVACCLLLLPLVCCCRF